MSHSEIAANTGYVNLSPSGISGGCRSGVAHLVARLVSQVAIISRAAHHIVRARSHSARSRADFAISDRYPSARVGRAIGWAALPQRIIATTPLHSTANPLEPGLPLIIEKAGARERSTYRGVRARPLEAFAAMGRSVRCDPADDGSTMCLLSLVRAHLVSSRGCSPRHERQL
jgi:hypothetical protein